MKNYTKALSLMWIVFLGVGVKNTIPCLGDDADRTDFKSVLKGKLVFHTYTSYIAEDGHLWLYDFSLKKLSCLSRNWPLHHAINGQFSPDGRTIVFMAMSGKKIHAGEWDVFTWKIGDLSPQDLTENNDMRDEDPKFSPDGRTIVFKQNNKITLMNIDGTNVRPLSIEPEEIERSMPYFAPDGQTIVFSEGARETSGIYSSSPLGTNRTALAAESNIEENYPIAWTGNRFLYSRWFSANNKNAQIYALDLKSRKTWRLPFNQEGSNASDPIPVDERYVIFSSTRGGLGGYDLYVGDELTGEAQSLSTVVPDSVPINTPQEELGATYTSK